LHVGLRIWFPGIRGERGERGEGRGERGGERGERRGEGRGKRERRKGRRERGKEIEGSFKLFLKRKPFGVVIHQITSGRKFVKFQGLVDERGIPLQGPCHALRFFFAVRDV
jgi:hypothetical protein